MVASVRDPRALSRMVRKYGRRTRHARLRRSRFLSRVHECHLRSPEVVVQKADFHSLVRHARDDSATPMVRWVYTGHITSRCRTSLLKFYGKWADLVYRFLFHHSHASSSENLLTQQSSKASCPRAFYVCWSNRPEKLESTSSYGSTYDLTVFRSIRAVPSVIPRRWCSASMRRAIF